MTMTDTFRERDLRDLGINATITVGERHDLLVLTLSADDLDRLVAGNSAPEHECEFTDEDVDDAAREGREEGYAEAVAAIKALAEAAKAVG